MYRVGRIVRTHKNIFHSTAAVAAVRAQTRLTRNLHHKFAAKGHSKEPVIVGTTHWSHAFESCGHLTIALCVSPKSISLFAKVFCGNPPETQGAPLC